MDYYLFSIQNVLPSAVPVLPNPPLAFKRSYMRPGCKPHVAWVTSDLTKAIGTSTRLLVDDDEDREGAARGASYGVARFLTVDGGTGTRAAWYDGAANECYGSEIAVGLKRGRTESAVTSDAVARCLLSSPIPSGRRIAAMSLEAANLASGDDCLRDDLLPCVWVSDDLGNIYQLQSSSLGCVFFLEDGHEAPMALGHKRPRANEATPQHRDGGSLQLPREAAASLPAVWGAVVPARSPLPSLTCPSEAAEGRAGAHSFVEHFHVSRGVAGWVGLGWSASHGWLYSVREGFSDLRVIDAEAQAVVRAYGTTHRPTGMLIPCGSAGSPANALLPHTVLVTEGCLATLFDVRCPSAVMTLAQLSEAAPRSQTNGAQQKEDGPAPHVPLVPGRLTSITGAITDVCCTANPFEVAFSIDRALCVYDVRKFNRVWTSPNVLKYRIASVAALASGRAVVCAGIDSEVRVIALYPRHLGEREGGADLSLASRAGARKESPTAKETPDTAPKGNETFRARLNLSVTCQTTWQGGWVTCSNHAGAAAVGVSMDSEFFMAQ